ncbi:hypothetical protein O181_026814 [Austropuccinia psidii MF-1]|uniref:Uncharacterized protein n=1 Tax=Austropuccinia psidii MF-1 TaxID=1389203 RepID=A0A9Q3CMY9_9BASI|nr:hypothetical protein [Austropuccinia psidii MF-1]
MYSLRSQTATSTVLSVLPFTHGSDSLVPSDFFSNDNQYFNQMGDETPRFKKDKSEVLQNVINQTKVPSWFSRLPRKFGFKNFQTLKAAEWPILITLYLPLALVPLWSSQIPHKEEMLENNEIEKDPFHPFPDLNCSILLDQTEDAIIINSQSVLSHAESLKNPPGTFGIDQATLCLVSLH